MTFFTTFLPMLFAMVYRGCSSIVKPIGLPENQLVYRKTNLLRPPQTPTPDFSMVLLHGTSEPVYFVLSVLLLLLTSYAPCRSSSSDTQRPVSTSFTWVEKKRISHGKSVEIREKMRIWGLGGFGGEVAAALGPDQAPSHDSAG